MNRRRRSYIAVAFALSMLGAATLLFALFQSAAHGELGAGPSLELARYIMEAPLGGYADGKACCKAGCSTKPTLAERTLCCSQVCPQFVDECVEVCIAGMPRAQVFAEISVAGVMFQRVESTEGQRAAGRHLLDRMKAHDDPGYAHLAGKLIEVGS